jgi:hypothetical protein
MTLNEFPGSINELLTALFEGKDVHVHKHAAPYQPLGAWTYTCRKVTDEEFRKLDLTYVGIMRITEIRCAAISVFTNVSELHDGGIYVSGMLNGMLVKYTVQIKGSDKINFV